jgi:prophage antirepressor-like protein
VSTTLRTIPAPELTAHTPASEVEYIGPSRDRDGRVRKPHGRYPGYSEVRVIATGRITVRRNDLLAATRDTVSGRYAFHGQPVRVIADEHGDPWFVAADVCSVVGISKYRDAVAQMDEDERASMAVDTLGGRQSMTVVNEPGIYTLMLISRSPQVKPFKRWLTTEVLPSIRRTGSYGSPSFDLTSMDDVALLLTAATNALTRVRELEPPAAAWHALADSTGDYSLRDAAQILDRDPNITTGQNRLGQYLRQIAWIDPRGIPYQRHVDLGRIQSRARTYKHPRTGEQMVGEPQVRLTVKGIGALHKLLGGTEPVELRHLTAVSA